MRNTAKHRTKKLESLRNYKNKNRYSISRAGDKAVQGEQNGQRSVTSCQSPLRFGLQVSLSICICLFIIRLINLPIHYYYYCRAFSQKELEDHKSLFVSLAAQSQSDGKYIFPSVFKVSFFAHSFTFPNPPNFQHSTFASFFSQRYFGLHGPLGDRMFDLLSQQRKDQRLSFQDLIIAKVTSIS